MQGNNVACLFGILSQVLSSLSENQRSQSRSLSSIVDEKQSDSHEIRQLK